MASRILYADIVNLLKNEYSSGVMFGESSFIALADNPINNTGFFGSSNIVFLTSLDSIIHEAPACIAAPLVNMVAKKAINFGLTGQGLQPEPVRLYAPKQLSITTKHLSIGDISILVEPKIGLIFCEKLTLSKSSEEDPEYFEMVKSWAINDKVEIEKILHNSK